MCLRVTFIAEMDRVIIAGRGLGWPWARIADKVGISVPLVRHRGVEVLGLDLELPHKSRQVGEAEEKHAGALARSGIPVAHGLYAALAQPAPRAHQGIAGFMKEKPIALLASRRADGSALQRA